MEVTPGRAQLPGPGSGAATGAASFAVMKHAFLFLFSMALLAACGDGKADAAQRMAAQADSAQAAAQATVDLAQFDVPLLLTPPDKQLTGGAAPTVLWKDEIGKLEVKAGEHFGLTIVEEPGDIARLKADLDRDLLKKNTVLKETPDLLVYKSEFPDDPSLVFVHFYQVMRSGDRSFVVEDVQAGMRFTEQDVERMAAAVGPKLPA